MKSDERYKSESRIFFDRVSDKKYGNSAKLHSYLIEKTTFKDGEVILDMGCGRGEFIQMIYDKNINVTLRGLDISPKMIDRCKERSIPEASFMTGDSEDLPYKDDTFDRIFCLNSFHHYPNPERVAEEMKRVLKGEGTIVIGEIHVVPILREFINLFLPLLKSGDYKMYSKKSLNSIFKEKGFENIDFKTIGLSLFIGKYRKVK